MLIVLLQFIASCSAGGDDHKGNMSFDGSSLYDCGLPVVTLPFCCLVPEW